MIRHNGKSGLEMAKMLNKLDLVEVVRCKDCKWYTQFRNRITSSLLHEGECEGYGLRHPDDFCSRGERKEE